jgi:polyisoprenyl-teichoic acid--peptidoglycan teichoic acid transferase
MTIQPEDKEANFYAEKSVGPVPVSPPLQDSQLKPGSPKSRALHRDTAIVPDSTTSLAKTAGGALVKREARRFNLRKLARTTFWAGVFGTTAIITASLGAIAVLAFPFPRQLGGEPVTPPLADLWRSGFRYQVARPVNILIMGLDEAHDVEGAQPGDLVGRTDTILLTRVDPAGKNVNVMSIPRDTRVEIPGYGMEKINQANFEGGAELAAQTVMHNFNNVEIDRYVRVSTAAFREIVDLVGGIEVTVPKPMKYEDKTQGLVIDLEPGLQTLNGDQAEQFARFRQDSSGDIGRVQRQQMLLKALRKRMTDPRVLPKLPQIIRVLQSYIDTNLSLEEMLALAGFGLNLDSQNLQMVMLPGRFSDPEEYSASFWISDEVASSDLMRTYFDAAPAELVADAGRGTNYTEPPSEEVLSTLKIAVQNATDDPYASTSMADHLRELGFDNVYVMQDWSDVSPETSIVAQRGDLGSARSLQSAMKIGQVESDSTGDIESDITIRVGEDWMRQLDPNWERPPAAESNSDESNDEFDSESSN